MLFEESKERTRLNWTAVDIDQVLGKRCVSCIIYYKIIDRSWPTVLCF